MPTTNKPMVRIHNTETDEIIDREMTAAEFKVYEAEQSAFAAKLEADQIRVTEIAAAKQSAMDKLTALGLTADEVAALI